MPGESDTKLAQSFYLANMYAQRGECQCTACQLLRNATDGMISQMLGGGPGMPGVNLQEIMRQAGKGPEVEDPSAAEVKT